MEKGKMITTLLCTMLQWLCTKRVTKLVN